QGGGLDQLVTHLDRILVALVGDRHTLEQFDRHLLAARFDALGRPGALELLELFFESRLVGCLVARPRPGSAGCGEHEGAEQCHKCHSHTCSPSWVEDNDTAVERPRSVKGAGSHYFIWAIWMRFPQVSSNTAVVTGP